MLEEEVDPEQEDNKMLATSITNALQHQIADVLIANATNTTTAHVLQKSPI